MPFGVSHSLGKNRRMIHNMKRVILAIITTLLASSALAANVVVNWTFDTSATATCHGSTAANPLPAATYCPLTSFQVQEQINGIWTTKDTAVAASLRSVSYANVAPGRKCYRVLALSNTNASGPSNEACIEVPYASPKAPVITVTISVAGPE